MKKGHFGATVAAPVFKRIAERSANYLAIPSQVVRNQTLAITNHSALD